jgi:hypothetical protein
VGAIEVYTDSSNGGKSKITPKNADLASAISNNFGKLKVDVQLTEDYQYPFVGVSMDLNVRNESKKVEPVDLSQSKGFSLKFRSDVDIVMEYEHAADSSFDRYTTTIPMSSTWKEVYIPWKALARAGWDPNVNGAKKVALDLKTARALYFAYKGEAYTSGTIEFACVGVGTACLGEKNPDSVGTTAIYKPVALNLTVPRSSDLGIAVQSHLIDVSQLPTSSGQGQIGLQVAGCQMRGCSSVDVLIPGTGTISVSIFDHLGTPVIAWQQSISRTVLHRLEKSADGRSVARVKWNLRTASGRAVASGVYLWKIQVHTDDGKKLETIRRLGVKAAQ